MKNSLKIFFPNNKMVVYNDVEAFEQTETGGYTFKVSKNTKVVSSDFEGNLKKCPAIGSRVRGNATYEYIDYTYIHPSNEAAFE